LKSALFGTPARPDDDTIESDVMDEPIPSANPDDTSKTPSKPAGILLTPGTGTYRRKRVSFGHDVVDKGGSRAAKGNAADAIGLGAKESRASRKRTKLTEALESSRRSEDNSTTSKTGQVVSNVEDDRLDDEWEEEDDNHCTHDVTVDLNEPHSRSGKYWKSNFEQYHQDAKAEMEKLLKYKQLAKSYAKMKDAEAFDLQEKLKEEQERVIKMDRTVKEMKSQIASKGDHKDNPELKKNLARQTALAEQYRDQVKELEALLQDQQGETDSNRRPGRQATSPRTHTTLLETKRELRKARAQIREIDQLRDEVRRLRSDLSAAQQRASKLAEEPKSLATGQSHDDDELRKLKDRLEEAKKESCLKDNELRRLREEYAMFRDEAEARQDEAKRVLEKATDKISDLKKEIKALKTGNGEVRRPRSYPGLTKDGARDEVSEPESNTKQHAPTVNARDQHRESGRRSIDLVDADGPQIEPHTGDTAASRTLREKFQKDEDAALAEPPHVPTLSVSNILAERPNLERPRWQPYHPRSPRHRDNFTQDLSKRIFNSGDVHPGSKPSAKSNFDLPVIDEHASRPSRTKSRDPGYEQIDLLQSHFARLGVPDVDSSAVLTANTSRSTLPPERVAAAKARIRQRNAERKRTMVESSANKENIRP
jgi:Cut12 conserved domain